MNFNWNLPLRARKSQNREEAEALVTNLHGLRKTRIIVVIAAVAMMINGCSQFGFIGELFSPSQAGESHTQINDDFSDKDSGWGQFIYPEASAVYKNDAYQITINVPNSDVFITYPRIYINSVVQADINKVSGSNDNNFGLICRFEDERNFYAGQVSSDGYAGIFKVKNGEYELIGIEEMVPVAAILGGEAVNEVRLECIQDTITLYVNGEIADTQTDETFISGEVGMIAGTISGYDGVFQFDNFIADAR